MTSSGEKKPRMISAAEFAEGWDTERSVHELNDLTLAVRGTTVYIPVRLKSDMDDVHGGPVTHVRYRTFAREYRVWLTPCRPGDKGARALNPTTDTNSAAQLAFGIPLRKMHVTVPETRQYVFDVEKVPAEGGGVVYEISFKDFSDERRQVDAEALAAIKQAKEEQAKVKRAQKRAERLAKINGPAANPSGTGQ